MATRTYAYAEAMAAGTANATTTFTDRVSVTFTPGASETWAIIGACGITSSSTVVSVAARLNHDTATTVLQNAVRRPLTATTWHPFGVCQTVTFGGSPGSNTFSLEYADATSSAQTSNMRDATLFAIKLSGNDATNKPGTTPTAVLAYTDIATFTAPANGVYDIFGSVEISTNSVLGQFNTRLLLEDGATASGTFLVSQYISSADKMPSFHYVRRTLTTGQTVKLQFNRPAGSSTLTATNGCITGFDISNFDNTGVAADGTSRNTSSAAYVQRNAASTLTFTPAAAVDHYCWGASGIDMSSTSDNPRGALHAMFAGTEYQDANVPGSSSANSAGMMGAGAVISLPTSSTTLSWEYGYLDASPTVTSPAAAIGYWQLVATPAAVAAPTGVRFGQQRLTGRR